MITPSNHSGAVRYDTALRLRRKRHIRADGVSPVPTCHWPPENVQLLERYFVWMHDIGLSRNCILQIYIPIAGHLLGLELRPHPQIDLAAACERALNFVRDSGYSAGWQKSCWSGLNHFQQFMRYERGTVTVQFPALPDVSGYHAGLPDWLVMHLTNYQRVRQVNWRPARLREALFRFWKNHTVVWQWLFAQRDIVEAADVRCQHLYDFMDARLSAGMAVGTINTEVWSFQATLRWLQQHEVCVPLAVLRMKGLKQPQRLPRFLTDGQMGLLKGEFDRTVQTAKTRVQKRDARLNRAAFYLMWQAGLRVGEVEELRLDDLDLSGQRLVVRQGKGRLDRAVYLTTVTVAAIADYLTVRGEAWDEHLFIYRFKPVSKDLLRARIKATGERVGVKVTPHQLRHTFATQLINAGCKITTIQRLLGHQRLNSTLVYARVHDQTVADDYFKAMASIELKVGKAETNSPKSER